MSMETMDDPAVLKADSRFSCNICLDPVTEPVVTRCGHLFCWPCLYRWLEPGILPEEALPSWDPVPQRPVDESRRCCPVCKAPSSVPTIVPIYVRNEPNTPLGSAKKEPEEEKEEEEEEAKEEQTEESAESGEESTGLRQRLRFRSRDSDIPNASSFNDDVPSRPAAVSPTRTSSAVAHRQQTAAYIPPRSPQPSLSHGMLLIFQQALENPQQQQQQGGVPPLHRNSGEEVPTGGYYSAVQSPRDDATEFLSRILLILASFVILCVLLF